MNKKSLLILLAFFWLVSSASSAKYNYKIPVRDFSLSTHHGWHVNIDKLLSPETEAEVLAVLKPILKEMKEILPEHCIKLAKKKNLKFFIMYDRFNSRKGMSYIRNNQSNWDRGITKQMNISIIIHNPKNFASSLKEDARHNIIHEIAHFYHLENYGASYEPIWRCFLLNKRKYEGQYAAVNHMEYFAETSALFFSRPYQLAKDDPFTTELLRGLWKKK